MNDVNSFFYKISQQMHKMHEKENIIIRIWQRAQCYVTSLSNASYLITVTNMKKTYSLRYHNPQLLLGKSGHNYSTVVHSQILFYMQQRTVVPDHGTQYEETGFSHHWGMWEEWQMDWISLIVSYNFKCRSMFTYCVTKTTSFLIFRHLFVSISLSDLGLLKFPWYMNYLIFIEILV